MQQMIEEGLAKSLKNFNQHLSNSSVTHVPSENP
jgi:hypothetical protein